MRRPTLKEVGGSIVRVPFLMPVFLVWLIFLLIHAGAEKVSEGAYWAWDKLDDLFWFVSDHLPDGYKFSEGGS